MKNNNKFLLILTLAVIYSLCISSEVSAADDPSTPNFLFIQSDQFRFDMIRSVQDEMARYDGKTKIRTPNLDRLRAEGVYFRNTYTQCAVCVPSRSTFRTGCTVERHGVQANELEKLSFYTMNAQLFQNKIEADVTFEQVLVENKGYVAEHYGKWHMPEIFNWSQDGSTQIMQYNDFNFVTQVPGFSSKSTMNFTQKIASLVNGQSTNQTAGMQENTFSRYPYITGPVDSRYEMSPYTSPPTPNYQQGRDTLPENLTTSYLCATAALAALDRIGTSSVPFVVTTSFDSPHLPMIATKLYYDYASSAESVG